MESEEEKVDENKIQDKIIIPVINEEGKARSIKLKFPTREAIVHCPGCHVTVNLSVSDFGIKQNLYEVWPQRVEKDLEERDKRVQKLK